MFMKLNMTLMKKSTNKDIMNILKTTWWELLHYSKNIYTQ